MWVNRGIFTYHGITTNENMRAKCNSILKDYIMTNTRKSLNKNAPTNYRIRRDTIYTQIYTTINI